MESQVSEESPCRCVQQTEREVHAHEAAGVISKKVSPSMSIPTGLQAPMVASHSVSSDAFWGRLTQRTAR